MIKDMAASIHRRQLNHAKKECFSEIFGNSPDKQKQWQAFVKRSQLTGKVPEAFVDVWRVVTQFLKPLLADSGAVTSWPPGGPWG